MEIKNYPGMNYSQVNQTQNKEKSANPRANDALQITAADRVALSAQAKIMGEIHQAANKAPDLRTDKVDAIKDQLATGSYQVNNEKIASRLLQSEAMFSADV